MKNEIERRFRCVVSVLGSLHRPLLYPPVPYVALATLLCCHTYLHLVSHSFGGKRRWRARIALRFFYSVRSLCGEWLHRKSA
jgi:hypothetical protein